MTMRSKRWRCVRVAHIVQRGSCVKELGSARISSRRLLYAFWTVVRKMDGDTLATVPGNAEHWRGKFFPLQSTTSSCTT